MGSAINCQYDHLNITEVTANGSEQTVVHACGSDFPSMYISNGSHLALVASKSPNFDGEGWSLQFDLHDDYRAASTILN